MPKKKLDFSHPMTRELIVPVIDKEMKLADDAEGRALALNYMTQMVEQGYVVTPDPAQRYTVQETMDMTWAYMDGYNDAMKTLELNMKKMMEKLNIPPGMGGGTLV